MTGLWVFLGILLVLTVAAIGLTKLVEKGQRTKSIGDLLNEESKANEDLREHNEVLKSTPESGASKRVSDNWTRPA